MSPKDAQLLFTRGKQPSSEIRLKAVRSSQTIDVHLTSLRGWLMHGRSTWGINRGQHHVLPARPAGVLPPCPKPYPIHDPIPTPTSKTFSFEPLRTRKSALLIAAVARTAAKPPKASRPIFLKRNLGGWSVSDSCKAVYRRGSTGNKGEAGWERMVWLRQMSPEQQGGWGEATVQQLDGSDDGLPATIHSPSPALHSQLGGVGTLSGRVVRCSSFHV